MCVSNEKQLSLAILQYLQDYDETMVPAINCETGSMGGAPWCASNSPTQTDQSWVYAVFPYVKTQEKGGETVWLCPSLEEDYNNIRGAALAYPTPFLQYFVNYGLNKDYLQPDPDCAAGSALQGVTPWGMPVTLARIEAPASTVLMVETKPETFISGPSAGAFNVSSYVNAPADGSAPPVVANGITMHACSNGGNIQFNNPNDGWGVDDEYETSATYTYGIPNTSTNMFDPRHTGGGNVAFTDGHCRWMTPGALAAGTNWYKGIPQANVRITNLSQYLWSLNKSGTSDM
jgi:prepilin-type processing-associated H-X9-DG protein